HWNTSWDWARFEVVGHKWADLSEGGYGVSLLNDCKYGYDIKDSTLRLTLIKSGIQPDPKADRGEHRFVYSLLPHAGDWYAGGTVEHGYRLNNPLLAVREPAHRGSLPPSLSLVHCTAPHVMVETVKQAEDREALVVRVYEFGNRRGPAELVFCRRIAAALETNLLEEEDRPLECAGRRLPLTVGVGPHIRAAGLPPRAGWSPARRRSAGRRPARPARAGCQTRTPVPPAPHGPRPA